MAELGSMCVLIVNGSDVVQVWFSLAWFVVLWCSRGADVVQLGVASWYLVQHWYSGGSALHGMVVYGSGVGHTWCSCGWTSLV